MKASLGILTCVTLATFTISMANADLTDGLLVHYPLDGNADELISGSMEQCMERHRLRTDSAIPILHSNLMASMTTSVPPSVME